MYFDIIKLSMLTPKDRIKVKLKLNYAVVLQHLRENGAIFQSY